MEVTGFNRTQAYPKD